MEVLKFSKSAPIQIIPYQADWPKQFAQIAAHLNQVLGTMALRIDHIGSTSVPELAAKDIIDIQITINSISNDQPIQALTKAGYKQLEHITSDNYLGNTAQQNPQLEKRLFKEIPGNRRANIHIRQINFENQQFALLFRDYLRAVPEVKTGYLMLKTRLAEIFPESIEGYLYFKEPAMGLIFEGAKQWATAANWQQHKNA